MRLLQRVGCECLLGLFFSAAASGQTPSVPQKSAHPSPSVTITATDAERASLTFTKYDGEVHLVPSQHSISVRIRMTVRNDGPQPLQRIALQISSSLTWYSIHVDGRSAKFAAHKVDSDLDHTGQLTEAVVPLAQPLAAGASLSLDVLYSGVIDPSAERLTRIGAPANIALSSDWDRISSGFTGLRGFGHVLWMPVSTVPVLLGQGAQVLDAIGQWKQRESNASLRLHLLVEYHSQAPTLAILNGEMLAPDAASDVSSSATADPTILHVASFTLPQQNLGFHALDLFVLTRSPITAPGITLYPRAEDEANAASYQQAAELVRPTVEQWLGTQPKRPIVLVDLPESDDFPSEDRNILFLPFTKSEPKALTPMLAHIASHAYFVSPRPWLSDGVAQFVTTLWIEHLAGRDAAMEQLDARRAALALAEPAQPGKDAGQSLILATRDIYTRDKAAYVFWMLRDLVGDGALSRALKNYNPALDLEPGYFQKLTEQRITHQAPPKNIEWFFDDWVYRDRGLPDLKIIDVHPRPLLRGNVQSYLVTVEVENDGDCAAQVPVTLQSAAASETSPLLVRAGEKAAVRILMESLPTSITVNDGTVPEVQTSIHQQAIPDTRTTPAAQ